MENKPEKFKPSKEEEVQAAEELSKLFSPKVSIQTSFRKEIRGTHKSDAFILDSLRSMREIVEDSTGAFIDQTIDDYEKGNLSSEDLRSRMNDIESTIQ